MSVVDPVKHPRTRDPVELDRFFREIAQRLSYQVYAGDPTGNVTPRWIGERCLDTTNDVWYFSHGIAATDWAAAT